VRDLSQAISQRVERLRAGRDPFLLAKLSSGYAIFGKQQPTALRGCCMLLPDPVVASPNELAPAARAQFFADLVLLGDALLDATGAERVNYLVLCNQVPQLHGHCIPRFAHEDPRLRGMDPFAAYDFGAAPLADAEVEHRELLERLRQAMRARLQHAL
jgi:diadenosine tetraphosphate (Ap4A) HIT family hydrolase